MATCYKKYGQSVKMILKLVAFVNIAMHVEIVGHLLKQKLMICTARPVDVLMTLVPDNGMIKYRHSIKG